MNRMHDELQAVTLFSLASGQMAHIQDALNQILAGEQVRGLGLEQAGGLVLEQVRGFGIEQVGGSGLQQAGEQPTW